MATNSIVTRSIWLCLMVMSSVACAQKIVLNVGVLLPWTGDWPVGQQIGAAAIVAINDISNTSFLNLLPENISSIEWEWKDTQCNALEGVRAAISLWRGDADVDAFIGGGCSAVCRPVALLAASLNIPFVSFGCTDDALSNKMTFPTFSRTQGPWTLLAPAVDEFLEAMHWKSRIGIVSTYESIMISTTNEFKVELQASDHAGHSQKSVVYLEMPSDKRISHGDMARFMKPRVRVIIIMMYSKDVHDFLLACRDEGMMEGDYAFITLNADLSEPSQSNRVEDAAYSYNGIIDLHVAMPQTTEWNVFAQRVLDNFDSPKFDNVNHLDGKSATIDKVDVHALYLYDAFLAWAHGMNRSNEIDDGRKITEKIRNSQFEGILDMVKINDKGDRQPDYSFSLVQNLTVHVPLFKYRGSTLRLVKVHKPDNLNDFSDLVWKGERTSPPVGHPPCGWDFDLCDEHRAAKVCLSLLLIGIVLGVIGYLGHRKYRSHQDLLDTGLWMISKEDMETSKHHTQVARAREVLMAKMKKILVDDESKLMFRTVVRVKGELASVQKLNSPTVYTNKAILLEMQQMREMSHENINPFIAAVCKHPSVAILMLYTDNGSLQDVMFNSKVEMTWDFQISFSLDVAKGMQYLHESPFGSHGHLTSSNCVVDRRWVCKVTDYGCEKFKSNHIPKLPENSFYEGLLWTAPERLPVGQWTMFGVHQPHGTKEGDIYSYGIILSELTMCNRPFADMREYMEAKEVVELVADSADPPVRPGVHDTVRQDMSYMMKNCWDEEPKQRPTFKSIIHSLGTMHGTGSFSLMERMPVLMEEHSEQLEKTAKASGKEINIQKQKVNKLLTNILPLPIAKVLASEVPFQPVMVDSVSILICHVTKLKDIESSYSAPQIIDIMDSVYSSIDDATIGYDICEVQNFIVIAGPNAEPMGTGCGFTVKSLHAFQIGTEAQPRSHMVSHKCGFQNPDVASGWWKPHVEKTSTLRIFTSACLNPNVAHEVELTFFAINLLKTLSTWSHPSLPDVRISMRMGLNSGPLSEVVLGRMVPRFHLFGKTREIALELLKSNTQEMSIHVTQDTAKHFQESDFKLSPGPGLTRNDGTTMSTCYLKLTDQ